MRLEADVRDHVRRIRLLDRERGLLEPRGDIAGFLAAAPLSRDLAAAAKTAGAFPASA